MGCDIHLFAEIKVRGKWELYAMIPFPRWYGAFEKLAGVRGEVSSAIAPPRGIPLDASRALKFQAEYVGLDGHSHSWISAKEIADFDAWLAQEPPHREPRIFKHFDLEHETGIYFFGNSFADVANYKGECRAVQKGVEDLRFVFWFDN